jgi:hypothetical protein
MSGEGEAVKRVRQMTGEDGKDKESDAKSSDRLPLLGALDQRWRNWWIRGILSIVMISLFAVVIYLGPIALSLLVRGAGAQRAYGALSAVGCWLVAQVFPGNHSHWLLQVPGAQPTSLPGPQLVSTHLFLTHGILVFLQVHRHSSQYVHLL